MSKVPSDVERLMWLIAENRDVKAIAEFETRFPDLKFELAKRISMVNGLKHAGRASHSHDIPRFVPRSAAPAPMFSRASFAVAAIVLAAAAFGTYAVTSFNVQTPKAPPVTRVDLGQLPSPNPQVEVIPPQTSGGATSQNPSNPDTRPSLVRPHPVLDDPAQKPITVKGTLPLVAAIQQICQQAGLTVQIAPGLTPVESEVDFQAVSASEALMAMGQKYGFTAVPQERGSILIIPVRPDADSNNGQSSSLPSTDPGSHPPVSGSTPDKR